MYWQTAADSTKEVESMSRTLSTVSGHTTPWGRFDETVYAKIYRKKQFGQILVCNYYLISL
jgi:hypothetical protein